MKRISALLIVAFLLQVVNNALFFHTHTTASGKIFHHAHPNCGHHSHSDYQFNFYDQLQLLSSVDIPKLINECTLQLIFKYEENYTSLHSSFHFYNLSHRGPPVIC
nr:hypothetical protein [uncultured Carboxylicivirga sp.]